MLSSCKLKEGRKKKKKERREKGIRAGKLERMDYRYMVVWGCVCMRVLKNRETSFFFALFHPTPPHPPLAASSVPGWTRAVQTIEALCAPLPE